ncbi:MAG: hypothetical protein ABL308_09090 [Oceanicaulis sp.]
MPRAQISFLTGGAAVRPEKLVYDEDLQVFGQAVGKVDSAPSEIAAKLGFTVDRGADGLDRFDILALSTPAGRFGFVRHDGEPAQFAHVCDFDKQDPARAERFVKSLFPEQAASFEAYPEPW